MTTPSVSRAPQRGTGELNRRRHGARVVSRSSFRSVVIARLDNTPRQKVKCAGPVPPLLVITAARAHVRQVDSWFGLRFPALIERRTCSPLLPKVDPTLNRECRPIRF